MAKNRFNNFIGICVVVMFGIFLIEHFELVSTKNEVARLQVENATLRGKPVQVIYRSVESPIVQAIAAKRLLTGRKDPEIWEKNNNWLNIKKPINAERWLGQIGVDEFDHAIFEDPIFSIRAASFIIYKYVTVYQIDNISDLVKKFCTGNWNEYIAHLCKALKVKPTQTVDLIKRMPDLLQAMAHFETGIKFPRKYFVTYDLVALMRPY